jgi:4-amino-4-deoxy-L-arabinose transferase-like glycosyltransferase
MITYGFSTRPGERQENRVHRCLYHEQLAQPASLPYGSTLAKGAHPNGFDRHRCRRDNLICAPECKLQAIVFFRSLIAEPRLPWLLAILCTGLILFDLGGAALFEPDEGRNAERAREILVLDNWVIPHENFLPALDKPMFFYWLIALSFKLFGIAEWPARLPSALAALGCLFVVYRFVRERYGLWEALWSALILATSLEFFVYSRLVILDTTLTFFTTVAFFAFYSAVETDNATTRRRHCLLLYLALACATLLKGLTGILLPGMVAFCYLALTKRWRFVGRVDLLLGAVLYLAIVLPFYLWAEARHPGYLEYYFWEEHFLRFFTPRFQRDEPWYFFFVILASGFFPWTFLLPQVARHCWKNYSDDKNLYLALWIVLPFVFFSLSRSKLPHYLLPIFPPLSIVTAIVFAKRIRESSGLPWFLIVPCIALLLPILYFIAGSIWQILLPLPVQATVLRSGADLWIFGAGIAIVTAILALAARTPPDAQRPRFVYLSYCAGLTLFLLFTTRIFATESLVRSAHQLAQDAAPFAEERQLVFYDSYLTGMPFYLRAQRPIWVVWSGTRRIIMQNIYVAQKRPRPVVGYGEVLFTFDQFRERWRDSGQPLLVFVEERTLPKLAEKVGGKPKVLSKVNNFLLVSNQ